MIIIGIVLLLTLIVRVEPAPSHNQLVIEETPAFNEAPPGSSEGINNSSHCVNSTLYISLRDEGTQFRVVVNQSREVLFVNYSINGHEEVFNLVDRVFTYLFPTEEFALGKPAFCVMDIVRSKFEDGEVIRAVHEGETLLELTFGKLSNSSVLVSKEVVCVRIVGARVDVSEELEVNRKDKYNFTALHWASFFNQYDLAKRLISRGANVNLTGPMNVTSLKAAVATGDLELVRLLVENGADVNSASYNGMVPIIVAINTGRLNMVKFLIEKGANLSASYSALGSTPLHIAAQVGNVRIVRALVESGVDVYQRDRDGSTALHLSARHAHSDVVGYLIGLGMDVDVRDQVGRTPLIRATDNSLDWDGAFQTIKLLIEAGADLRARDRNGQSPLSVLSVAGHDAINQLLRSRGF